MHQKVFIVFKIYNFIFYSLDKSFTIRPIIYQNNEYKLQIWDTSNDAKTNKIHKEFFVGTKGVFLIYDITNLDSFKNIKNYKQVDENIPGFFKILIGYNCKKENRAVSSEEGKKLANELKIDSFFELPSNYNERIDKMLNVILAKKFFDDKNNNNCLIIWI